MTEEGFVEVGVRPSTAGFAAKLRQDLTEIERRLPEVDVQLAARLARGFAAQANQQVKTALERVRPEVELHAKLAKGFVKEAQTELRVMLRDVQPEVQIRADVAERSVTEALAQVRASVEEAERATQLDVRVDVDTAQLVGAASAAIEAARVQIPPLNVAFDVDTAQLTAVAVAAIEGASAALVSSPINARFDVDPAELVAKAQAAVIVAQESISGINVGLAGGGALGAAAAAPGVGAGAAGAGSATSGFAGLGGAAVAGLGAVTVATGAAGGALLVLGSKFDAAFDLIRVQTGATGAELEGLKDSLRAVGASSVAPLDDVAAAIAALNQRTGATGPTLEAMTRSVVDLSRVTGTDLKTNLASTLDVVTNFGVDAGQIPGVLDQIFRASQVSGVGVAELAAQVAGSGAALRTAGFGFTESVALVSALSRAGVPAQQVLSGLSSAARKLAKDGIDPAKGIRGMLEEIQASKNPTEALGLATELFGRSAVGVVDAVRSGRVDLTGWADAIAFGGDTVAKAAAASDDFPEAFSRLRNRLSVLLEPIATPLISSISEGVDGLAAAVTRRGPEIQRAIGAFGPIIANGFRVLADLLPALVPVFGAIGSVLGFVAKHAEKIAPVLKVLAGLFLAYKAFGFVSGILGGIGGALIKVATAAFGASSGVGVLGAATAVLTSPVTLVVAAVAALAGGLYLAYQNIEPFRNAVDAIGRLFRDTLWPALKDIGGAISAVFGGDLTRAGELLADAGTKIGEFFSNIGPLVGDAAGALWDWIVDTVPGLLARAWDAVRALGSWLWNTGLPWLGRAVGDAAGALWAWIKDSLPGAIDGLWSALRAASKWLLDTGLPAVGRALKSGAHALWDWIVDNGPGILRALGGVIVAAGKWIVTDGVPTLARAAWHFVEGLIGWVADVAPRLLGLLWGAIREVGGWLLGTAVPWLAEQAVHLLGAIVSGLGDLAGKLISWAWGAFTSLLAALPGLAGDVLGWFVDLPFKLIGMLIDFGGMLVDALGAAFKWLWDNLPGIASAVWDWFRSLPGKLIDFLGDLGSRLWGWATAGFNWLVDNLPSIAQGVWDFFKGLPGKVIGFLGDAGSWLFDTGKKIISGLWDGIKSAAGFVGDIGKDVFNAVGGFLNEHFVDNINKASDKLWDALPFVDPPGPHIPRIPKLAAGGLVKVPTVAVVGEAGPELVLPLSDPARVAQLLAEAGVAGPAGGPVGLAGLGDLARAGAASVALPDLKPAAEWVTDAAATVGELGPAVAEAVRPGVDSWRAEMVDAFAGAGARWVELVDRATGRVGDVLRDGGARWSAVASSAWAELVAGATSAGARIADALAGGVSGGTTRVASAVRGYATALTGALNPILSAIGQKPVVLRFAGGGYVPGPDVRADVVPALLMPGEVVVRRDSVRRFGVENLLELNEGRVPVGWTVPRRFAAGGAVADAPLSSEAVGRGRAVADAAVGKPYVWGAVGPAGFDCSGLWSAVIRAARNEGRGRLFTSASLIDNAKKVGMLPGHGQISVGAFKGNPGHVAGTIAGRNYEATPPRVRAGAGARGAADRIFTHRFHVGSGLFLAPGETVALPPVPELGGLGELSRTATSFAQRVAADSARFVEANTFTSSTSLAGLIEPGSVAPVGTPGALTSWLLEAIRLTGVPSWWLPYLVTGAMRESGGNPRAINLWDSNARRGTPSKGLLQTIDPTFEAYKLPGHGDIWNPVDNAAAAIRYILARYGDIRRVAQFDSSRAPRGYAEGGLVEAETVAAARRIMARHGSLSGARSSSAGPGAGPSSDGAGRLFRDVQVTIAPPAASSPEAYGAALVHRVGPAIASAVR